MATNTFSIHFVLKQDKVNKEGFAPIFAKVFLNGTKLELSTGRKTEKRLWLAEKEKVKVVDADSEQLNEQLQNFKTKLYSTFSKLQLQEEQLTAELFKQALKGKKTEIAQVYTLVQTAIEHNLEFEKQGGKKYSYGSYKNYKTTLKYLLDFVPLFSGKKDIPLSAVDYKFCEAFFNWLTTTKDCHTNGANKQLQRLKKIINYSIRAGYILANPCASYSLEFKPFQRTALQPAEIKALDKLKLKRQTLLEVRDVFLFQCYTGLSYADVFSLGNEHISKDAAGSWWVRMQRQKTGVAFAIPLLEEARKLLEKYLLLRQGNRAIFPVLSNQKMNQNLKVLQELAAISKNLTSHLARHTFATTITLSNGVPIETVSRMLGHTKLSTTQVYAKVVETKIEADMKSLSKRLKS